MLGCLGLVVGPRRGGGRGEVAGHGEVIDVSPFNEPRARLFVAKRATRGKGEGVGAELLVGLGALEKLRGHIAVPTPDEGTVKVLSLLNHPVVQIKVTGRPPLTVPVIGASDKDGLRARSLHLGYDGSAFISKRFALAVGTLEPTQANLPTDQDRYPRGSATRVVGRFDAGGDQGLPAPNDSPGLEVRDFRLLDSRLLHKDYMSIGSGKPPLERTCPAGAALRRGSCVGVGGLEAERGKRGEGARLPP